MRYSSSRIQQDTRLISVDYLIQMVQIGRLDPSPAVGALTNWGMIKKSHIVESLILGLPIGMIWAEQDALGKTQLLSGFEVVINIIDFKNDVFRLKGLRVLKHLEGLRFSEIDFAEQKHFMQMEFSFGTIRYDSDPMLKCFFVESINKDKYGNHASQIARNIIFKGAREYLESFIEEVLHGYADFSSRSRRNNLNYQLKIQTEMLLCLLFVYVGSENRLLNSYPLMESYSYSRSHISRYSNYNEVDINFDDDIDNAVNKIMFMLEFDEERIHPYFLRLEDLIRDAFRVNEIDIDSVGRDFYSSNHHRIDGLSLLECVASLIFDYSGQLKIDRFSSIGNLMRRLLR